MSGSTGMRKQPLVCIHGRDQIVYANGKPWEEAEAASWYQQETGTVWLLPSLVGSAYTNVRI